MKTQHILLYGYGAFRSALLLSFLHAWIMNANKIDTTWGQEFWPALLGYFLIFWICTILAILMSNWTDKIKEKYEKKLFSRKQYVNTAGLGPAWFVIVLLTRNPFFALFQKYIGKPLSEFMKEKV